MSDDKKKMNINHGRWYMVSGVPLDLKTLHSDVIFEKISSKITIVVITDSECEGMYVCM